MASFPEELRKYIEEETGVKTYIAQFPPDSDESSYCVNEYGGGFSKDGINHGFTARRVQVSARAVSYAGAARLGEAVFRLLDSGDEREIELESMKIISRPRHAPLFIEFGAGESAVYGCNFVITTRI